MHLGRRFYTKLLIIFLLSFIYLLSFRDVNSADLYKWTDSKGEIHITDYPPPDDEQIKGPVEVIEEKGIKAKIDKTIRKKMAPYITAKSKKLKEALGIDSGDESAMTLFSVLKGIFRTFGSVTMFFIMGAALSIHFFYALCLYLICRKIGISSAWLAWIPILNIFPLIHAAGTPWWWGLFFLAPLMVSIPLLYSNIFVLLFILFISLVDILLFIVIWIKICVNIWINKWFGLFILVPLAQFILIGYLAFKKETHRDDIQRLRPALIAFVCLLFILGASYTSLHFLLIPPN